MLALLLVIIISGVRVCLSQSGLEAAAAASASVGFGLRGGSSYGNLGYGSGSHYYGPESNYGNRYGGLSNVYVPGRLTPFGYSTRRYLSPLDPYQTSGFRATDYTNVRLPQTLFYQSYQRLTNPDYPYYSLMPTTRYYSIPYLESVETYKFDYKGKKLNQNSTQVELIDSEGEVNATEAEINANNKTLNKSSDLTNSEESPELNIITETEPVLRMKYLGYVPPTSFKSSSQSNIADDTQRDIPFYILSYDDNPSASQQRSSASQTVYVSPTRLLPTSQIYNNYPSRNFGYSQPIPIVSPFSSVSPRIDSQRRQFSSLNPPLPGGYAAPTLRSVPTYSTSSYRSASSSSHPGFYLFDITPVSRDNYELESFSNARSFNEPILGTISSINPLIPQLGPMGQFSKGINTNTHSQTGYSGEEEKFNKFENQNFNTGFETHLPNGHAYSNFQSNKEVSVQKYDGRGENGFNTGFGSHTYGPTGLLV